MERASEQHREAASQHAEKERIRGLVKDTISAVNDIVQHNPLLFGDSRVFELERKIEEIENKQEKEVFTMLLARLRKHPEEFLKHLFEFTTNESMQDMVFEVIVKTIGQTDPERGFQLLRQNLMQSNPEIPADNLRYAERRFHEQMACAVLVQNLEKGLLYIDTYLCKKITPDEKRLERYQRALSHAKYESLGLGKLEHALVLHKKEQEIEQKLKPDKLLRFGHEFEARVAKKMLGVDIERAIEIHEQSLEGNTTTLPRTEREHFAVDVKEARVRKLLREGDVLGAREKMQELEQSEVPAERHRAVNLLRELKGTVEKKMGEIYRGSESIKPLLSFYRTLPEDFPSIEQYRKKVLEYLYVEASENIYEAGQRYGRAQKEEKNEAIGNEMKRLAFAIAPELLLPGAEGAHARDDMHWIDRYQITLRATEWTGIAMALKDVPSRQQAFAAVPADNLLFGHEHTRDDRGDLIDKLFQVQRSGSMKVFAKGIPLFADKINSLPKDERNFLISQLIGADAFAVFTDLYFLPKLTSAHQGELRRFLSIAAKELFAESPAQAAVLFNEVLFGSESYQYLTVSRSDFIESFVIGCPVLLCEYLQGKITEIGRGEVVKWVPQSDLDKSFHAYLLKVLHFENLRGMKELFGVGEVNIDIAHQAVTNFLLRTLSDPLGCSNAHVIKAMNDAFEGLGITLDYKKIARQIAQRGCTVEEMLFLMEHIPDFKDGFAWGESLDRLLKLQARAANEDNDPWKTDFEPLVEELMQEKILDTAESEDGELLVEFVRVFGMVDAPKLARVFFDLKRASGKEKLKLRNRKLIRDFIGERQFGRLESPADLLNELQRVKAEFSHQLLEDGEVPGHLTTELGQDIFGAMIGKGSWERGDSVEDLAQAWKRRRKEIPERARVPRGYEEFVLDVPLLERGVETLDAEQKRKRRIEKVVKKPGVQAACKEFFDAFYYFGESQIIAEQLMSHREIIVQKIQKKLKGLQARAARVEGRVLESIEGSLRRNRALIKVLREIDLSVVDQDLPAREKEKAIVAIMEQVEELKLSGSTASKFMRLLSLAHIGVIMEDRFVHWEARVHDMLGDDKEIFDQEDLSNFSALIRDFINEHYLHEDQRGEHTGHTTFSPQLLRKLVATWGLIQKVDGHFICRADKKVKIIKSNKNVGGETVAISAIPGHGVMRIFSGDTGNACYTSRHSELANGDYPNLHAFTLVSGRNTHRERFVGSTLAIEARRKNEKKNSTLIVRANNPRENLIQNVDSEAFLQKMLDEMIELAKRRGLDRVVVPLDGASQSCSNRDAIADFYQKYFSENPKISLASTPETNFNGYDVYRATGVHPCVVIWDKEHGKIGADGWGDVSGEEIKKKKREAMKGMSVFSEAA
jgi:hypothetical protein